MCHSLAIGKPACAWMLDCHSRLLPVSISPAYRYRTASHLHHWDPARAPALLYRGPGGCCHLVSHHVESRTISEFACACDFAARRSCRRLKLNPTPPRRLCRGWSPLPVSRAGPESSSVIARSPPALAASRSRMNVCIPSHGGNRLSSGGTSRS